MLFDTLALISLIVILLLIRKMINIFPSLAACLIRWKENVNLQLSLKMRTDRNKLTCALFIPFCLTVFQYRLYCPQFLENMADTSKNDSRPPVVTSSSVSMMKYVRTESVAAV